MKDEHLQSENEWAFGLLPEGREGKTGFSRSAKNRRVLSQWSSHMQASHCMRCDMGARSQNIP